MTDLLGDRMQEGLKERYSPGFEKFWTAWPKIRKKYKPKAFAAWQKNQCERLAEQIVAHVEVRAKQDQEWRRGYVPMPTTFLNGHGWTDEYEKVSERRHGSESRADTREDEPPQTCHWTGAVNTFLLRELIHAGGAIRTVDFERVILKERDCFIAQMKQAYGDRIPTTGLPRDVWDEWIEIREAWKEKVRGLFRELRTSNPESAYKSIEAAEAA